MNEPDGVPCEPGSVVHGKDGVMWICDDGGNQYTPYSPPVKLDLPDCPPRSMIAWNAQLKTFECIGDDPLAAVTLDGTGSVLAAKAVDPLWIILIMAVVFTVGALGMGLSQWWRNRKAKTTADLKSWQDMLVPKLEETLKENQTKAEALMAKVAAEPFIPVKETPAMVEPVDKNPDSLQDEIKEIYSLIQLARNDINKITGFMQLCVTPAMENLNKARDRVAALGGKVK